MKLLFLLGNCGQSPERRLAEAAEKLIGKDAEVIWHDPALPLPETTAPDGVWIFTHDEEGGCPSVLMQFLEENFARLEDVPVVATGIGGKEGGMNAATEIEEYFEQHGGRYFSDSDPLFIPLRTARFELEPEEKMDLFFLVDEFLKYCGMDDSESRKIAFDKVVDDCFRLLKFFCPKKPSILSAEYPLFTTDEGVFDFTNSDNAPAEIRELHLEIDALCDDYEIEAEEILPALREKIDRDW